MITRTANPEIRKLAKKIANEMYKEFNINIPNFNAALRIYKNDNCEFKYLANTLCILKPCYLDSELKFAILSFLREKLLRLDKEKREIFKKRNELTILYDYIKCINWLNVNFAISESPDFIFHTSEGEVAIEVTVGNMKEMHEMDSILISNNIEEAKRKNRKMGNKYAFPDDLSYIKHAFPTNSYYDMLKDFICVVKNKCIKKLNMTIIYTKRILLVKATFPMEDNEIMFEEIKNKFNNMEISNYDEITILATANRGFDMAVYNVKECKMTVYKSAELRICQN